jgi:hypothetical protein
LLTSHESDGPAPGRSDRLNPLTETMESAAKREKDAAGLPAKTTGLTRWAMQLLQRPLLPLWLALLGMLLTLPALRAGLIADDLYHRSVLTGARVFNNLPPSAGNMFRFFDGDASRTKRMMDLGTVPWFTWPAAKGGFWRPVTVLTHWLDYQIWPNWPVLMHVQSILWFGAVVVVVTLLYRRIMLGAPYVWRRHVRRRRPAGEDTGETPVPQDAQSVLLISGLAALLYTIDDARGLPVGFLANRNTLICTFFGVLALLAHHCWRKQSRAGAFRPEVPQKGSRVFIVLAGPLLLALSLLAKEEGIGVCAYLLAYAVFLDRGSWRDRLLSLAPYAVVVVAWRIAWTGLGFGVDGVGYCVDPLREPVRFFWAVLERGPILLLGQWGLPPAEITLLLGTTGRSILWAAAVLFMGVVGCVVYPLIRGGRSNISSIFHGNGLSRTQYGDASNALNAHNEASNPHPTALARFWMMGMLLAIIPICTTFPADRMLSFVGLGAMGLLAQFFVAVAEYRSTSRTRSAAGIAFIGVHLIVAPAMLPLRAGWPTGPGWSKYEIRTPLDDSITRQDLVLVNPPSAMHVAYFAMERDFAGLPLPRHIRQLASGPGALTMQRLDERTLEIRPKNGYGGWAFERLFRAQQHPFKPGDHIDLTGMKIEIAEVTSDGRPAVARFCFDVPLEDGSLRWLAYEQGEFRPFVPPRVGGSVHLAGW